MSVSTPLSEISIEITKRCLQDCEHCSSRASNFATEFLPKEEIMRIATDFKTLGGKKIELSGGEPLLHNDISCLINALKQLDLRVHLFTSGTISENNQDASIDAMVQLLKQSGVDKVIFSLHGANKRTHDEIVRLPGSFSRAVQFITKLVKENIIVGIHFVPMASNFVEFVDLVKFAASLKVTDISVLRFVPQGRGEDNRSSLMLNKVEVAEFVELLTREERRTDISVKVGSHLDFTFLLDNSPPKPCTAGKTKCLVEVNGDVIPCAVFKGMTVKGANNFVAGNLKTDTLSNVWNNSKIFKIFRDFDPNLLVGACKGCNHLFTCKGRCPAQRIYDHEDFYTGPDDYCPKEIYDKRVSKETSL